MSETPKKPNRRRRRRPRRRRSSTSNEQRAEVTNTEPEEPASTAPKSARRRSDRRRGRSQRSGAQSKSRSRTAGPDLIVHKGHADSIEVSPINPDIFIYTHTLRPRHLLDDYQTGPNIVERMLYENNNDNDIE